MKFDGRALVQHEHPYMQSAVKSLTLENKSDVVLHLEALLVKREIISHFGHNFRLQT